MKDVLFGEYASTDGHGGGTTNWNGDYSSVEGIAKAKPPAGKEFTVWRMIVAIEDTSGFQANEYGDLGAALTNGIAVKVRTLKTDGTYLVHTDLMDGTTVKTNADWGRHAYDVDVKAWGNTPTNELLLCRYTFARHGAGIHLNADDEIAIFFNDNLTGLVGHHYLLQGQIHP